jgi:CRP-like cAMP-binding protein
MVYTSILVLNINPALKRGRNHMSTATVLPFTIQTTETADQQPAALLFEFIEQRFGKTCSQLEVKRGRVICSQGSKLSCLYLIQQGEVLLTRSSPEGKGILISVLGPGEFFGENSLLSGTEVAFSASTKRNSVLLQLPERKFKLLLEEPQSCRILTKVIASRCDDAWTQLEILGCTLVRDKVRTGLLWLSGRIGVETRDGVRIDLNQTQIAGMVGCAREALSREVSKLRRLQAVDIKNSNGRKALFVVDHEGLN